MFVVVDHINVPSLYHLASHERLGVLSGAELFVLLAGVVLGLVFRKRGSEERWLDETSRLFTRARALYFVALFVVLSSYLLSLVPWLDGRILTTFTDQGTGTVYNLYPNAENAGRLIASVILLRVGPSQFNIIGLYVVLLLAAPFVLLVLLRGRTALVLGVSWLLWGVYAVSRVNLLPAQFEDPFPLLAWQLLFVNGLALGFHRRKVLAWMRTGAGRALFGVAVAVFLAGLFYTWNNPVSEGPWDPRLSLIAPDTFYGIYERFFGRQDLGIGRLVNVAAFVIVAYALLSRFWGAFQRVLGWLLVPLGQASLYVFILQVYFALIVASVPVFSVGSVVWGTLAHTAVLLLLWLMVRGRVLFRFIPR